MSQDRACHSITPLKPSGNKVDQLVESFLSGRNPRTIEAYRLDLESFGSFLGAATLSECVQLLLSQSAGDANLLVLRYRAHLVDAGLQPTSINRKLAAIRSMVRLARTLGVVTWTIEIQNLKAETYRDTRGPGQVAFQQMLEQVEVRSSEKAVRDFAILRLLYDLALRASELTGLDLEDIDPDQRTISILGKGRMHKELLSLPEPTYRALTEWVRVRGRNAGALFVNFDRARKGQRLTRSGLYQIIRRLGHSAGVKTRPHGLRHLSITEACKLAQANGFGLEEVLDHSRHKNVTTLMIYRDRERNVQGQIANLVAETVDRKRR